MNPKQPTLLFLMLTIGLSPEVMLAGEQELAAICAPYRIELPQPDPDKLDLGYTDALLWRVSKNDIHSFVFGTMHTQDQRFNKVPPQVRVAITQSKIFLNEVEQDQAAGQTFVESMYLTGDKTLNGKLHPELVDLLKYKAEKYGIDKNRADQLQPWAAFSLIGRPKPTRSLTLDQNIMNFAFSRGLQVHALETIEELIASLDSVPEQDQLEILADTLCNHSQILQSSWDLLQLYIRNDLAGMVRYNFKSHRDEEVHQRFTKIMVNQRNQRLFQRSLPWLMKSPVFIAVGASHIHGSNGLLSMFVGNGFTVEPVW